MGFIIHTGIVDDIALTCVNSLANKRNCPMSQITDIAALRALYPPAGVRSLQKQLAHIDPHAHRFISLSPFVLLASANPDGLVDVSPRGGPAGFVQVLGDHTLILPDWPGNNRLDSLMNIIKTGEVGLLFLIPGVDETLRVNGPAQVRTDSDLLGLFNERGKQPTTVLHVQVRELYLHCAKALMRSALWSDEARQPRSVLPTMGEMIRDQAKSNDPVESQEEMVARYKTMLY